MSQPLLKLPAIPQALPSPQPVSMPQPKAKALPTVTIVEEPAAKKHRFRYKCDCRSVYAIPEVNSFQGNNTNPTIAINNRTGKVNIVVSGVRYKFCYKCECKSVGAIPGVNSLRGNKTYPTIRINNYTGLVTIAVSCVTMEHPYKPHPHNLVGRLGQEGFKHGVFVIRTQVTRDANEYQFRRLGVQRVKRTQTEMTLKNRAKLNVDPFKTGFEHARDWKTMNLKGIRLAFQVFLNEQGRDKLTPLNPVVSNVVYDKKTPD